MSARIMDLVCVAVLCTTLTLGLWPFHSPQNDVTWLTGRNGLHFGRYGTVFGSRAFEVASSKAGQLSGSIEIWIQPKRIWDSGTLLTLCTPRNPFQFSLRQSETELRLQAEIEDDRNRTRQASLDVDDAFRKPQPMFITITTGASGTAIYIDGILLKRAAQLRLPANQFTGRLVLGDSAGQPDSWPGRLLGFAMYDRELREARLVKHYETWTQAGAPEIQNDDANLALYLFDEHTGNVVHNHASSEVYLSIPDKYVVLYQLFLQPFWTEFSMSRSYWGAALKNIVGFIPFGFCFCARLSMARRIKRAALMTVVLGALVSLTIEILQSQLPTRDSGTTDLITNTLGTWVGAMAFRGMAGRFLLATLGIGNVRP